LPILEHYQIPSINFLIWDHMKSDKRWRDSMTLEEVKQIANHPLVTLGAHSISHRNLNQLPTKEAWIEINESKEKLEKVFKRPFYYFCYPEGSFSDETMQLVQRAGYRLAFRTSLKRLVGFPVTFYSIPRVKVHRKDNLFVFWLHAAGFTGFARQVSAHLRELTGYKENDTLKLYGQSQKTT
ncbi:MAG: polysaccharide deacetylase family protein, partial [Candidatus Omnitrophica bacterium]|nr:polysaccharide deacetylase family protein [Candidatus Omnitrophota bacterium]